VAPSFQRSPTSWAHDVRFAERKPSGKNPNVPLTTKDSSHFQQQRQAPLESARAGGGWGSNIGRAPASERTAGREGRRGPLPSTPHEAAEVADGWARMGDGSRWTESESLKGSVMGAETASIATSDKLRAMRKVSSRRHLMGSRRVRRLTVSVTVGAGVADGPVRAARNARLEQSKAREAHGRE